MPKRTAKPCLRIDKHGDELVLTIYKVVNMRRMRHAQVRVPANDKEAIVAAIQPIYDKLRAVPVS